MTGGALGSCFKLGGERDGRVTLQREVVAASNLEIPEEKKHTDREAP